MNYIQTGDIQSYYEYYESASTSSTTIVFIHGTGLDSSYFHYLIPILRQQYSILLYDLRGHGQSEDGGKAATIELLCDDLLSLVQALGLHNLVIVGHTFGANIAVHFADRYETLIESLILISPQAFLPLPPLASEKELREELAKARTLDKLGEFMVQRLTVKHKDHSIAKRIIQSYARLPVKMYMNHIEIACQFKLEHLRRIHKPALVLSGESDPLFPPSFTSLYNSFLHHSKFLIVPDSSNMVFFDQPAVTVEWIMKFIQRPKSIRTDTYVFTDRFLQQLMLEGYNRLVARNKVSIQCMGGFEVQMNGRVIREGWNTRYAKNILIYLAFRKTATREELCDMLFPEMTAKKALGNLRVYLNHFAKLFEARPEEPPCLAIDRDSIYFKCAVECDLADVMEEMNRSLEEKDSMLKYAMCKLILPRATQHILPGCFDAFSLSLKEKFAQDWEKLAIWAADYCCKLEQFEEAAQFIRSCLHSYPNDEGLIERMVAIQKLTNNKKELRKWTRKKKASRPDHSRET
ncbi:alpha/beta fold hydrolase [Paenibacillus naphthalenovorans]|uniref:alpha/beta fold hydrolase n=1 Tax=Paenibacillus naphthalenovorans TaxID=162209 RepID=UPI0010BA0E73|nr:alpha/beta hydrolase [Paenibacillus naphthalenovorans]GCL70773.1 alpha/beta hydrolase [Paenibacillus naphthalenovorans]